ncbi:hypothetical protein DVH05_000779 [Phytophthora capsici]|nr:hypothetical protein DVH05_000779 [Phytophthora capsici]
MLARYSSGNYKPEELGKPVLEMDLEQGDLLYFPRGFIHQARAHKEKHSLDLTVSTGQQNTMGNFLEVLLPQALAGAINTNVDLRRSLPRDYLDYMGVMHSDREGDSERKEFANKLKGALKTVLGEAMGMLDAAADQMAKNFLVDRLPPALEDEEENCTSDNSPLQKITVNTQLKLIRHGVARMVIEDGKAVVYHCRENSRMHHEVLFLPLSLSWMTPRALSLFSAAILTTNVLVTCPTKTLKTKQSWPKRCTRKVFSCSRSPKQPIW